MKQLPQGQTVRIGTQPPNRGSSDFSICCPIGNRLLFPLAPPNPEPLPTTHILSPGLVSSACMATSFPSSRVPHDSCPELFTQHGPSPSFSWAKTKACQQRHFPKTGGKWQVVLWHCPSPEATEASSSCPKAMGPGIPTQQNLEVLLKSLGSRGHTGTEGTEKGMAILLSFARQRPMQAYGFLESL